MGEAVPTPRGELESAYGAAFKAARRAKSWTLIEMAEALGVGVNTIRWHEAGATIMAPDKLFTAAKLLDVGANVLGAQYRAQQALNELDTAALYAGASVGISKARNGHNITIEGVRYG